MGSDKREAKAPPSQDERHRDQQDHEEPDSDDVAGHIYTGALKEQKPS
jgi:hypothetical protein